MSSASKPLILLRSPLLGPDLEAALLAAGHGVVLCEVADLSVAFLRELATKGAGGFLSVNHSPELALLCREARLPYVSWTVDPLPLIRWAFVEGGRTTLFVHRKALVEPLLRMGHPRVEWMPLAAPSRRWTESFESGRRPPSFVGSSLQDEKAMFTSRLDAWGLGASIEALVSFLDSIAAMAERNRDFRGFLVHPQTLPATLVQALEGRADPMDLAEAMDAGLAWRYRRLQVSNLAGLGVLVHGDSGWEGVVAQGQWLGPLRSGTAMTRTYRESALNFDVPRLHQREIATLRAFDVLASGGLLVAEAGTELEDLFRPGEEFLAWTSPEQRDEWIVAARSGGSAEGDRVALAGREAAWNHRLDLRVHRILDVFEANC